MKDAWRIRMKVNGEQVDLEASPTASLASLLRENLGLTGTKIGCNEGECGSCTVLMNDQIVNSCLVLAAQANDAVIWTIEGITPETGLHPIQKAFLKEGAVQCGFCTPGLIMTSISLLRINRSPSEEEIREAIAGNLCRCTGYHKIIRAIQSASININNSGLTI